MNRIRALLVGTALAIGLVALPAAEAIAAPAAATSAMAVVQPDGAPTGCPLGDFCAYQGTNGKGHVCPFPGNAASLGACYDKVGSVFNNGVYVQGYSNVAMYALAGHRDGCWAALGLGDYYLDLHKNTYNHGAGGGCGQALFNHIRSMRWY
jgi:hypothetical protein